MLALSLVLTVAAVALAIRVLVALGDRLVRHVLGDPAEASDLERRSLR